jgi:type I restriction enzyme S subunit
VFEHTSWGSVASLVYGRSLKDRPLTDGGPSQVYGTNGPIGYTNDALSDGPGVIVGRKGEYRGIHYSPGPFWVIDTAYYLQPSEGVDMLWAYYALKNSDVNGLRSGSAIPSTTKADFYAMGVLVPEYKKQVEMATVLRALDDKIAANAELARTADRLACGLFTRSVAGVESGPRSFGDLCAVGGGGTPKSSEPAFWSGDTDWATPTDVTRLSGPYLRSTAKRITSEGLAACASRLYPVNSILMTSRATIGSFALAKAPMAVNQGFIVVNPTDKSLCCWFLHEMRSRVDEFKSLANGATFLELSRGNFKKLPVRLADPAAMTEFCARAGGLHDLANQALIESDALARLRDTLLPHLMSGRLRVRDAEKTVSDAV